MKNLLHFRDMLVEMPCTRVGTANTNTNKLWGGTHSTKNQKKLGENELLNNNIKVVNSLISCALIAVFPTPKLFRYKLLLIPTL